MDANARVTIVDPAFVAEKAREETLSDRTWTDLPAAHATPHIWRGMLPTSLAKGTHIIEIRAVEGDLNATDHRILRVE